MSGHIFISYKSQERDSALLLRDKLREWGYRTWLDIDTLLSKEEDAWHHEIESALETALAVICVVSPQAVISRYVTNEWDIATVKRIPIIPLKFQETALPARFSSLDSVDFTATDKSSGFQALQNLLSNITDHREPPSDPYYDYLAQLYDNVSVQLGHLMISTLTTYGTEGNVRGEAIPMQVMLENVPFTSLEDAFDAAGRRSALVGKPGAGKTVALLQYARDAIVRRVRDPLAPLPILANIALWDPKHPTTLSAWLSKVRASHIDISKLLDAGTTLLLLDGLDELGELRDNAETKQAFDPRVQFLQQLPDNNEILITCREEEYYTLLAHSPLKKMIELQTLDDLQLQEYLRDQPQLAMALQNDDQLRDLVRTPLLLSILGFIYEAMPHEERDQFIQMATVGTARDFVMQEYFKRRYQHEQQKGSDPLQLTLADFYQLFGRLTLKNIDDFQTSRPDTPLYFDDFTKILSEDQAQQFIEWGIKLHILRFIGEGNYHSAREWLAQMRQEEVDGEKRGGSFHYFGRQYAAFFIHPLVRAHFSSRYVQEQSQAQQQDASSMLRIGLRLYDLGNPAGLELIFNALGNTQTYRPDFSLMQGLVTGSHRMRQMMAGINLAPLPRVCDVATNMLNAWGSKIIPQLVEKLTDTKLAGHYRIASVLAQTGDNNAVDYVLNLLNAESSLEVQFFAAKGLGLSRESRMIRPLLEYATSFKKPFAYKDLVPPLIEAIDTTDTIFEIRDTDDIYMTVIRALWNLIAVLPPDSDVDRASIALSLSKHVRRAKYEERYWVTEALGLLAAVEGTDILKFLLLWERDPQLLTVCAWSLAEIADPDTGDALMNALQKETETHPTYMLIRALWKIKYAPAVDLLLTFLDDKSRVSFLHDKSHPADEYPDTVSGMALKALSAIGTENALEGIKAWKAKSQGLLK